MKRDFIMIPSKDRSEIVTDLEGMELYWEFRHLFKKMSNLKIKFPEWFLKSKGL